MWTVLTMASWLSEKLPGGCRCLAVNRDGELALGGWINSQVMLWRLGKE
jgi:hypothetical protein